MQVLCCAEYCGWAGVARWDWLPGNGLPIKERTALLLLGSLVPRGVTHERRATAPLQSQWCLGLEPDCDLSALHLLEAVMSKR